MVEYVYDVCKDNKETDMVFNKNADKNEIEKFENDCLKKVSNLSLMSSLKEELSKRRLNFTIEVLHVKSELKNYSSHLAIDIFNDKGERVCEHDEPNCYLMLCEPICYMHHGHIVGIDLVTDKEFLQSLELLIKQVKKC